MSIQESNNNVIENILSEINQEQPPIDNNNQQPNNNNIQLDPNNTPSKPSFNIDQSNSKIMNFINNFKSSIIVCVIIILFSFPEVNKLGKTILNIQFINNLKYSYLFPFLLNGVVGGVMFYYLSNLNI